MTHHEASAIPEMPGSQANPVERRATVVSIANHVISVHKTSGFFTINPLTSAIIVVIVVQGGAKWIKGSVLGVCSDPGPRD